jgi:hypothetical protein
MLTVEKVHKKGGNGQMTACARGIVNPRIYASLASRDLQKSQKYKGKTPVPASGAMNFNASLCVTNSHAACNPFSNLLSLY